MHIPPRIRWSIATHIPTQQAENGYTIANWERYSDCLRPQRTFPNPKFFPTQKNISQEQKKMQNWDWLMHEADLYHLHLVAREVFALYRLEEHNVNDMRHLLTRHKPTKFFHIQWIEYKIKALRYHPVLEFGLRILATGRVTYYRDDNIGRGYFDGDMAIASDGIETYESFNYNRKNSCYFYPHEYDRQWCKISRLLGTDVMWLYSNKGTSIFPYLERIFYSSKQFVLDHLCLPNVLQFLVMEYINWTNYKDLNWILEDVISVWGVNKDSCRQTRQASKSPMRIVAK